MKYAGFVIFLFWFCMLACKKTDNAYNKIYNGTVIGFDPCTGGYTDNSKKGFVIKIDSVSAAGAVVTVDTATTYNLPGIFSFSPDLFLDYRECYLFPSAYQDSFRFRFAFSYTPRDQLVAILCPADIYTGIFYSTTRGRQIIISKIYQ